MRFSAGQTLGHYRLVDKLGEGGMGVVWKARDLRLDRDVAVKFLPEGFSRDPGRRAFFEREAKAVAALRHPNIVTIYAVLEAEGVYFFTMEYVEGASLTGSITPGGVPFGGFLKVAIPLADAVAAAHERGIIHRDLKPANIMVDPSGEIKILDFGMARFLQRGPVLAGEEKGETATLENVITGTVSYMSPEQLRGEVLDHRTDIFALGVVLYELATGRHPFRGTTPVETIAAILKDTPSSAVGLNPRLPELVDRILERCLEKDARLRLLSAAELRDELRWLGEETRVVRAGDTPSIAVLPFADMSREKDQTYFCEGIAEEITNALCCVHGLRVAARTAAFRFRDGDASPADVGRQLGVATLLEGSVRKAGNRLRITAQLIDIASGYHLWSESYDREVKDIFEIQEEIARAIVQAMRITLTPQERGALVKSPTRHVQAYDYYLRGRNFYHRFGRHDIEFALQLFSRATELDSGYALAHAGLADCWAFIYEHAERTEAVRGQALEAARRAIELAPDSAQSQASFGMALSINGQAQEAERAFEAAVRLDPGLFEAWYFYARFAFSRGDLKRAARYYQEAMRARPEDFQSPLLVAQIYEDLGAPEEAREARRKGVALVADRIDLHPDDARALYMGANGLVALGERERGLNWARRAAAIGRDEPMVLYNLGCIYSLAGAPEEALDCLERAVSLGLTHRGWFENDSNLDPLRALPRFQALLPKLG